MVTADGERVCVPDLVQQSLSNLRCQCRQDMYQWRIPCGAFHGCQKMACQAVKMDQWECGLEPVKVEDVTEIACGSFSTVLKRFALE